METGAKMQRRRDQKGIKASAFYFLHEGLETRKSILILSMINYRFNYYALTGLFVFVLFFLGRCPRLIYHALSGHIMLLLLDS